MDKLKVEGTFIIDGLLEGRLFSDEDVSYIETFVHNAKKDGLFFHLAVNGNRFSVLPEQGVVKLPPSRISAEEIVCEHLNRLLEHFTAAESSQWMSTLRTIEYACGFEKQSLYGIGHDGKVQPVNRSVAVDTIPSAKPLSLREKLRIIAISLAVLLVLFGISLFFVPYKKLAARIIENIMPYNTELLVIETGPFSDYFMLKEVEVDSEKGFVITCQAMEKFPRTDQQLDDLWRSSKQDISSRLVIETLARRHLYCELYKKNGDFYSRRESRINWVDEQEGIFVIYVPFNRMVGRIDITY